MPVVLFDPGSFTPHYVDNLARALAAEGQEVEVIASAPLFEPAEQSPSYRVRHHFFRFAGGAGKTLLRRHARLRQAVKALSYPMGLWRTWRALKDRPPATLHVQWALLPALDALLCRRLRARGWRVVYTAHDLIRELEGPWHRRQFRRLYRQTDAIVVHAAGLAERLRQESGDAVRRVAEIPEGASTFPLAPDMNRARARQALGLEPDQPVLLSFGLIKPYKGLDYLLRAWPRVLAEFPQAKLLIAGEALMPFAPLKRLIDRSHIGDSVMLRIGYVPRSDVQYLFGAADAVVLPYVRISTSSVIPTAYRFARPVIASAVGGLPEIVKDGETGLLAPPCSETALAEAICRGLRDPAMLAAMGERGRRWFEDERSWAQVARRTLALYRSIQP